MYETAELRSSIGGLVFLITAILAGLSLIVVWRTADSIAKPMMQLCEYTLLIGKGNFRPLEKTNGLCEVEELSRAMSEMSEQLEHTDDMQKTFLQNASHELRTPLMSISGYAQGLQCGVFADSTEPVEAILSESKRLTELVGDLLSLSRMDCEKETLELRALNLTDLINTCLEQLGGFASGCGIRLVFTEYDTEQLINVDEKLFAQAFKNIVSNGIRFASTEVTVSIATTSNQIIVTVEDDGAGIAQEDMAHLFERFYKGKDGNYGLGLSIAKASLEYMGGEVRASNGERGAVFTLSCRKQLPFIH